MPKYVGLNKESHGQTRVMQSRAVSAYADTGNCNIMFDELFTAAGCFPLFLMKDPATGQFHLSAIFSLQNNRNRFVENGQWTAPYCPLNLKRLPFAVSNVASKQDNDVHDIYIDAESELLSDKEGSRLFDDEGEDTAFLKDQKYILAGLIQGRDKTEHFVQTLLDENLVIPVKLNMTTVSGDEHISGLYAVDHQKMKDMDANIYLKLAEADMLEALFLMKASYAQINRLIWMENQHNSNTILNFNLSPVKTGVI